MGYYRHGALLEDEQVNSEHALKPLRKLMYEMLLDNKQDTVIEYGRSIHSKWNQEEVIGLYLMSLLTCRKQCLLTIFIAQINSLPSVNARRSGRNPTSSLLSP